MQINFFMKFPIKSLTVALASAAAISSPVLADSFGSIDSAKSSGFYVTGAVGFGSPDEVKAADGWKTTIDTGFASETGIGYRLNDSLRTEITYVYNNPVIQKLVKDGSASSYLFSAYYDINNDSKWTPYIGAGVGSSTVNVTASVDDSDSTSVWQAKLGVSYDLSERSDLFGEFGYQSIGKYHVQNMSFDEVDMVKGQIGLRYFF